VQQVDLWSALVFLGRVSDFAGRELSLPPLLSEPRSAGQQAWLGDAQDPLGRYFGLGDSQAEFSERVQTGLQLMLAKLDASWLQRPVPPVRLYTKVRIVCCRCIYAVDGSRLLRRLADTLQAQPSERAFCVTSGWQSGDRRGQGDRVTVLGGEERGWEYAQVKLLFSVDGVQGVFALLEFYDVVSEALPAAATAGLAGIVKAHIVRATGRAASERLVSVDAILGRWIEANAWNEQYEQWAQSQPRERNSLAIQCQEQRSVCLSVCRVCLSVCRLACPSRLCSR
jgi:hypothetical protein